MYMCEGLYVMQEPGVMLAQYMYRKNQTQKEFQSISFHGMSYIIRVN